MACGRRRVGSGGADHDHDRPRVSAAPATPPATPPDARAGNFDRNARKGVLIMLAGIALFSVLNGMVKDQAATFPVNQIVFFRNALALPALLVLMAATGGLGQLRTRHWRQHALHGVTMTVSLMAAFVGFRLLPLADATAIAFVRPLLVTILAVLLLGERVRPMAWAAVVLGFVGVIVIARPGAGVVSEGAIYSVAAASIGALNMLQQRRLSLIDTTMGIVFWYMVMSSLVLLPSFFVAWVHPTPGQLLGLVGMGLASGICQYIIVRPLYYARASTLAPVQYTGMVWAIIIGFVWFGDVPTVPVLAGAAIVLAATLMVARTPRR